MKRQPLIVIAGPTASGKTRAALSLTDKMCCEIVSADSMQIYQDISIGTARPTEQELNGKPYHMINFVSLEESYSVAQYASDAKQIISEIYNRGNTPVLCGGTGLYIQSITENIQYTEIKSDLEYRNELKQQALKNGGMILLEQLKKVDEETANKLHGNDVGRVIRALEVFHATGKTMSYWNAQSKKEQSPYDVCYIVLDYYDRDRLYDRINQRVDLMVQDGLLEEAESILKTEYAPTAMQAIGYKELKPFFDGTLTLEKAIDNIKQSTRRYAKRQLSWFRHVENKYTIFVDQFETEEQIANEIFRIVQNHYEKEESI